MRSVLQDPLEGCVLSCPTKWHGRWKLELCPTQQQFDLLAQIPGIASWENKKKPDETGWYAPQSLLDMGMFPGSLDEYEPEPRDVAPSGMKLRIYEARAVSCCRLITPQREGMIVAGDPGLGKTVISLHSLWLDGYLERPGLIIGPNIAKGVWCDDDADARVHYGLEVVPLEGVKNIDVNILAQHKTFFCHYELLHAWQSWIVATLKPAWLIIDESHFLSHQKVQRSTAGRQVTLLSSIERRYGLTGTPIPNERLELWNQLAMVQPRQWGSSHFQFGVRYCGGHRTEIDEGGIGGHWVFDGESNDLELKARLAGTFLRFTTEEVQNELPPMERHVVEVANDQIDPALLDDYSLAQRDIGKYLKLRQAVPKEVETITIGNTTIKLSKEEHKPGAVRLVCLSTLIGLLSRMKQAAAINVIDDIMREHNRLVVFTWRVATAEWICGQLADRMARGEKVGGKSPDLFGPVHGEVPMPMRKALAREFAASPCSLYVATMGSAGTSINSLSAASAGLIVDLHWNTASLQQAEKRIHRDGSQAAKVDIYYLFIRSTVDDMFLEKLRDKAQRAAALAPRDTAGISLVQDLSPSNAGGVDLDLLCARLMDMS